MLTTLHATLKTYNCQAKGSAISMLLISNKQHVHIPTGRRKALQLIELASAFATSFFTQPALALNRSPPQERLANDIAWYVHCILLCLYIDVKDIMPHT